VGIDDFIIMPNHIHGIIVINNDNNVGTGQRPVPTGRYGLLSKIINAFKNMTTKYIRYKMGNKNFVWQRSFYDRVVRDQRALDNIRSYICFNPMQWDGDRSDS
jgi:REP element-mobilizing transposase RayT